MRKKKFLSIILSVIMMLAMIPTTAFAAPGPYDLVLCAEGHYAVGEETTLPKFLTDGKDEPTAQEILEKLKENEKVGKDVEAKDLVLKFYGIGELTNKLRNGVDISELKEYKFSKTELSNPQILCIYSVNTPAGGDNADDVTTGGTVTFNIHKDKNKNGVATASIPVNFTEGQTYEKIVPNDEELIAALKDAGYTPDEGKEFVFSSWYDDTAWDTYKTDWKAAAKFDMTQKAADSVLHRYVKQSTKKITVSFDDDEKLVNYGAELRSVNITPNAPGNGWDFAGWSEDGTSNGILEPSTVLKEDVKLTSVWSKAVGLYIFDSEDTSTGAQKVTALDCVVYRGEEIGNPEDIISEGSSYTIGDNDTVISWYKGSDFAYHQQNDTDLAEFETTDVAVDDEDYYVAVVEKDKVTAEYDFNGGHTDNGLTAWDPVDVVPDDEVWLPELTNDGWTFDGWYVGKDLVSYGGENVTVTDDTEFVAQWSKNVTYYLFDSTNLEPHNHIAYEENVSIKKGDTLPAIKDIFGGITVKDTYSGWYNKAVWDDTSSSYTDKEIAETADDNGEYYVAVITKGKCKITFEGVEPYADAVKPVVITSGSTVKSVKLNVEPGYQLEGWYDEEGNKVTLGTTTFDDDTTLTAKWQAEVTYYTYRNNDFDTTEPPVTELVVLGEEAVTEPPTYGWFTEETWADIKAGKDITLENATEADLTITAPTTFYGMEIDEFEVTFTGGLGEAVTNLPDDQTVRYGETVDTTNLPTPTREGYTFKCWSVVVSGDLTKNVNNLGKYPIYSDTTFTTVWAANTVDITFDVSDHAQNSEDIVKTIKVGNKVNAPTVDTVSGYSIVGWYDKDGNPVDLSTATFSEDTTLTPKWAVKVDYEIYSNGNFKVAKEKVSESVELGLNGEAGTLTETVKHGWYTEEDWIQIAAQKEYGYNDFTTVTEVDAPTTLYGMDISKYTVTFYAGDGIKASGVPVDQTVYHGENLNEDVINAVPTCSTEGMKFKGWTVMESGQISDIVDLKEYPITKDTDFIASWGMDELTVNFENPQGIGKIKPTTATVVYGKTVAAPKVITPDGYQLEGWYTSPNYEDGTEFDFATEIKDDCTLYARWSAKVTYNLYNSKVISSPEFVFEEYVPLGNQAGLDSKKDDAASTANGVLYGWFDTATWDTIYAGKDLPYFENTWERYALSELEVTEPVTVYGKYAKTFKVTFSAGEVISADDNSMPADQNVLEGKHAKKPADIPTATGYVFNKWAFDFDTPITGDVEIIALWNKAEYKITFDANGGDFVEGFIPEKTIKYGDTYGTLPTGNNVTRSGFSFLGWAEKKDATINDIVNSYDSVYDNTKLYAVWDASKVQVTYVANGGTVDVASELVDYGTVITRTATKDNLHFEGWYLDEALTEKYEGTAITKNTTLYAKYQAEVTFRVYENDTDSATLVEPKVVKVDEFAEIGLPTAADLGVTMGSTDDFLGWYTETEFNKLKAGEAAVTFNRTATADITLYAKVLRHYTVTFDSVGGTAVEPQDIPFGGTVTKPDDPEKEGHQFIAWKNGQADYSFETPVKNNLTLTAEWKINVYTVTFMNGETLEKEINVNHGEKLSKIADRYIPHPTKQGYTQDGWLLNNAKYDETAPIKGDITLYANWVKNEFTAEIIGEYTYLGYAFEPTVKVTDKTTGEELVSGLYTVTIDVDTAVADNNAKMDYSLGRPLNAGAYKVTVSPVETEKYCACEPVVLDLTVSPVDINTLAFYLGYDEDLDDTVAYDPENLFKYEYTGSPIEGLVDIWTLDADGDPSENLAYPGDYTLAYDSDITSAGIKTVVVTGIGNFIGTKELKYEIIRKNINIAQYYATITPESFVFNGSAQQPSVTVKATVDTDDSLALVYGRDYTVGYMAPEGVALVNGEPVYPGTYKVVIEGLGNYEGQVLTQPQFTITAKPINASDITVKIVDGPSFVYEGSAVTPEVVVTDTTRNVVLEKDVDYTVVYSNNSAVGTATITISGTGNYGESRPEHFNIVGDISDAEIADIDNVTYDGNAHEPELTVTYYGKTLTKGTDYTVEYTDNVDAGTATVTVTGTGNYTGTATKTFTIEARSIPADAISGVNAEYSATGSEITPVITVTDDLGNVLTLTKDYTVVYDNNIAAGTATITVTGTGNYTGTVTKTFEIVNSVYYTTGLVKYAGGSPVVGGTVTLKGTTAGGTTVSLSTKTDSTGRYYFTNLEYGTYKVIYKKSNVVAILNPGSPE